MFTKCGVGRGSWLWDRRRDCWVRRRWRGCLFRKKASVQELGRRFGLGGVDAGSETGNTGRFGTVVCETGTTLEE